MESAKECPQNISENNRFCIKYFTGAKRVIFPWLRTTELHLRLSTHLGILQARLLSRVLLSSIPTDYWLRNNDYKLFFFLEHGAPRITILKKTKEKEAQVQHTHPHNVLGFHELPWWIDKRRLQKLPARHMYYSRVCYWARAMCPYFSRPALAVIGLGLARQLYPVLFL